MKKLSIINENIFDGIGRRSKGGVVRKENEVKSVDLGLPSGTIWATCNLGASSPEEYGDYYAWGETEPKDKYYWDTYKFIEWDELTKYNEEDGKTILDPEDDAAHVVLGGEWHIPTCEQMKELIRNTTNEVSELNGVKGRLFTSNINNNTLFFPYAGEKTSSILSEGKLSYYLSSSILDYFDDDGVDLHKYAMGIYPKFNDKILSLDSKERCYGYSIRAVFEKNK